MNGQTFVVAIYPFITAVLGLRSKLCAETEKKETALLACLEKQQVASAIFLLSDTFQHRRCKMKGTMRVRREKFTVVYFEFESCIICVNFRVSG